jgi:hypothetical protein
MAVTIDATTNTITANATSADNAIGVGQTWQQFTVGTQRSAGTDYTNTTGRSICVNVRLARDDGILELWVDGLMLGRIGETAGPAAMTLNAIVPAGSIYRVEISNTTLFWYELR